MNEHILHHNGKNLRVLPTELNRKILLFQNSYRVGDLEALKWMNDNSMLTVEDVRMLNNWALAFVAGTGNLEMLKWLKETFGLTIEDARSCNNISVMFAAESGHLEILKYLRDPVEGFGMTNRDFQSDNFALHYASQNGHLKVVKFLKDPVEGFGL